MVMRFGRNKSSYLERPDAVIHESLARNLEACHALVPSVFKKHLTRLCQSAAKREVLVEEDQVLG